MGTPWPSCVERLLKSWDPATMDWSDPLDRWTIVAQILDRGDVEARAWLAERLSRDEIRSMIIASEGGGLSNDLLLRLRPIYDISESDMPNPWPHITGAWNEINFPRPE